MDLSSAFGVLGLSTRYAAKFKNSINYKRTFGSSQYGGK